MAKARSILTRLKAIRNIRKITRTMELIATARFKKAMDRATEAAAFTKKIAEIAADLSASTGSLSHPLLETHAETKRGVLLVLCSNRGLCGGYNSSTLRLVLQRVREHREQGHELTLEVSGKRGMNFLKFQRMAMDRTYTNFEDKPTFAEVDEIACRFAAAYIAREIDFVEVAYVRFVSAARQTATIETLLPFSQPGADATAKGPAFDYEFLPSAKEILEEIVPTAFKSRLFKCFLDAAVSEQIYRMVAMKGATENAGEMIGTLSREYNRARQSQITSELNEIIGGAAALEG
jgi:F-type H+-transporting ATPase subunit gamma